MKYVKPDFDATIYEIEDVITLTLSFVEDDPDGEGWDDIGG